MPTGKRGLAFRSIKTLFTAGTSCGLSDAQLLDRFAARDELDGAAEAAFEALVLRHGPMVLDVCRNVLGNNAHDADDAFQATFLILATKAGSVRRKSSVASWLYGVALRTASRLKVDTARRRAREHCAAESRSEHIEPAEAQRDFKTLHEEVGRLPSKYREPIILCYFEGMTHEMAAAQLRCPVTTVGVRLMRAKARLKDRLGRRGESFAPGIIVSPVSGSLIRSTVRSAIQFTDAGPVSLAVAQLTQEVSKAMLMIKLKAAAAVLLIGGTVASGVGFLTHFAAADGPSKKPAATQKESPPKTAQPDEELRKFQGTWRVEFDAQIISGGIVKSSVPWRGKWIIDGNLIQKFPDETTSKKYGLSEMIIPFKLAPGRASNRIDLIMPRISNTMQGIYQFDGDSLRICYAPESRPERFVDDPRKFQTVVHLMRLHPPAADAVRRSDLEELQGTWATKVELNYTSNGKPQPVELINEKWVIAGDTIRTFPRPTERQAGMLDERAYLIKLDPSKTPKIIDLEMPALATMKGIYELDGDSLRICFTYGLGKRPTAFVHDSKNDIALFALKRLRRTPEEIAPRFAIDPGCYWVTYPSHPGGAYANRSFVQMTEYESGVLRVHLAYPSKNIDEVPYRPVAFDADRKRYYPRPAGGAGSRMIGGQAGVALHQYRLDKNTLQGKSIKYVGVELVTPEALKREKVEKADEKVNAKP